MSESTHVCFKQQNLQIVTQKNLEINIFEIEGLLFLGFGPMRALIGKLVFPVFPIKLLDSF